MERMTTIEDKSKYLPQSFALPPKSVCMSRHLRVNPIPNKQELTIAVYQPAQK